MKDEVERGKVAFKEIDGLTIENRAAHMKAIPDDVLAELKACHVILKGPTTTPRAGDEWPNIESANVAMRKELDLFANVRPVKVPEEGIDWTFFRENTEGAYTLGSCGFETEDGISVDFTITTTDGTQRIAELAYDFARKNHKTRVSIVTKANIIKATDGKFLKLCQAVGEKYPEITTDDWYIDIMTAKLVDKKAPHRFQVFVLPNLYGDIITDEAAEFQGGVGTAAAATSASATPCLRPFTLGAAHGEGGTRPVRRPVQHAARQRDAAVPHRLPGPGGQTHRRAGQMHVHGKGAHRHGPRHRLHLHRVRRLRDAHHRDPLI